MTNGSRSDIVVVIGAGAMGAACARRLGPGYQVLLADNNADRLSAVTDEMRTDGFDVRTALVDVTDRDSIAQLAGGVQGAGRLKTLVHTAGVSEGMGQAETIFAVDTLGVVNVLDCFEPVLSPGTVGIFIISMAADLLSLRPTPGWTDELEKRIIASPPRELLALLTSVLPENHRFVYWQAKRAARLRVHAAAHAWTAHGARLMTISPGVISTAMTAMELPRVPEMRRFIELAGRIGTVEDIANAAQFLASDLGSFLNGSDLLLDGGTIAALRAEIAINQTGNAQSLAGTQTAP